jgi:hypothetical protein
VIEPPNPHGTYAVTAAEPTRLDAIARGREMGIV